MHNFRFAFLTVTLSLVLSACDKDTGAEPATPQVGQSSSKAMARVSPASKKALAEYEMVARDFLQGIEADASVKQLQPMAQRMLDLGVSVVPDYVTAVPDCQRYLEEAAKIESRWSELDPEVIERDYHQDGALPPMPNNVDCYHMKDVVVHPATALALLAQPDVDRDQVRLEIFEVVSHAIAVRTGSGFNSDDGD